MVNKKNIFFCLLMISVTLFGCSDGKRDNIELQSLYKRVNYDIVNYYQNQSKKDSTILIADLKALDSLGKSLCSNRQLVQLKMTIYNELNRKTDALKFLSTVPDSILSEKNIFNGKVYYLDGKIVRKMTEGFFAETEKEKFRKYEDAAILLENYLKQNIDEIALMKYIAIKCYVDTNFDVNNLINVEKKYRKYNDEFLKTIKNIDWENISPQ